MKRKLLFFSVCFVTVVVFALVFLSWQTPNGSGQTLDAVQVAFPNLTFNQPVGIVSPGTGTNRLFVIEQPGVIRVFENTPTATTSTVFLDLTTHVLYGGEQGLLGLAFHPNFAVNGYFYVDYVVDNPLRTVIARYTVSQTNPNQAQSNSELILMEIAQPFANHKGGQLAFGPDGYLYIAMGDGGSGGDPFGNGQNRSALLGKILRIDVNSQSSGRNYGIPVENPFAGNTLGYREEIFAYGFRNPWRFSFDPPTGRLWVGDVGQSRREEIDIVENGANYGWNIMEGSLPYSGGSQTGLESPIWEYGHDQGIAIIGGYVYRGPTATSLTGSYVYGDYGSGRIWALTLSGTGSPTNTLLADTTLAISSFGLDGNEELYICAFDGQIYKFNPAIIPEFPTMIPVAVLVLTTLLTSVALKRRGKSLFSPSPASARPA